MRNVPLGMSDKAKGEAVLRLLEGADVLCDNDGESYAKHVEESLIAVDRNESTTTQPVLELVVERVLVRIRDGEHAMGCKTYVLTTDLSSGR